MIVVGNLLIALVSYHKDVSGYVRPRRHTVLLWGSHYQTGAYGCCHASAV
jgi:hypothetical protein